MKGQNLVNVTELIHFWKSRGVIQKNAIPKYLNHDSSRNTEDKGKDGVCFSGHQHILQIFNANARGRVPYGINQSRAYLIEGGKGRTRLTLVYVVSGV